jgi:hypothetical protein
MVSLALCMACLGAALHALCVALLRERLEVEVQGGRYRLTRELRGLQGKGGEWIGVIPAAGWGVKG